MYKACLEKDESFEGMFFTAVKTTGIFCRPSCTARKPKRENVAFFFSAKEVILKGYRTCKVCRPLEKLNETPVQIREILKEIADNPGSKIKDADLVNRRMAARLREENNRITNRIAVALWGWLSFAHHFLPVRQSPVM